MVQFFSYIWDFFDSLSKDVLISIFSLIFVASIWYLLYPSGKNLLTKSKEYRQTKKGMYDLALFIIGVVGCLVGFMGITHNMDGVVGCLDKYGNVENCSP